MVVVPAGGQQVSGGVGRAPGTGGRGIGNAGPASRPGSLGKRSVRCRRSRRAPRPPCGAGGPRPEPHGEQSSVPAKVPGSGPVRGPAHGPGRGRCGSMAAALTWASRTAEMNSRGRSPYLLVLGGQHFIDVVSEGILGCLQLDAVHVDQGLAACDAGVEHSRCHGRSRPGSCCTWPRTPGAGSSVRGSSR